MGQQGWSSSENMDVAATHALVLDVLNRASSQDPLVLKPAELKLREWEIAPGFYNILCVSIVFGFFHYVIQQVTKYLQ